MKLYLIAMTFASALLATASPVGAQSDVAPSKRATAPFYILASGSGVANGKYAVWTGADLLGINFSATSLSQASKFYISNDGFNVLVAYGDERPAAVVLRADLAEGQVHLQCLKRSNKRD